MAGYHRWQIDQVQTTKGGCIIEILWQNSHHLPHCGRITAKKILFDAFPGLLPLEI
jgi:hypothetical protein